MVKKLLKHEFAALGRVLFPLYAILVAMGVLTRLLQLVEFDSTLYDTAYNSTLSVFVIACITAAILTWVMCVTRYYRHLFTAEGYLSFTLPVTPAQHIGVKLVTAIVFELVAVIAIVFAVTIALDFDLTIEIVKAGVYWIKEILLKVNGQFYLYVAEILLLVLAMAVYNMLVYYSCMTLGQLAKKSRVGTAVGIYVLYTVALRILLTVGLSIIAAFGAEFWDTIAEFFTAHPYLIVHLLLIGMLVAQVGLCVALFFICRYVLTRRLNLE